MARLNTLVASLLADVVQAQDAVNRYAASLHSGGVAVAELSLHLKCAFRTLPESSGREEGPEAEDWLDVLVDSGQLADLPASAVHEIFLKIIPGDGGQ